MGGRMHWTVGACVLVAGGYWLGGSVSTGAAQVSPAVPEGERHAEAFSGPIAPANPNTIVREPVLVYDLSGTTLVGEFHTNVVVYNDGFTTLARRENIVFPDPDVFEDVATGFGTPQQVQTLIAELRELGAAQEGDADFAFFDVPLATVTFFPKAGPRATANTYSFSSVGSSPVEQAIDNYVDLALGM